MTTDSPQHPRSQLQLTSLQQLHVPGTTSTATSLPIVSTRSQPNSPGGLPQVACSRRLATHSLDGMPSTDVLHHTQPISRFGRPALQRTEAASRPWSQDLTMRQQVATGARGTSGPWQSMSAQPSSQTNCSPSNNMEASKERRLLRAEFLQQLGRGQGADSDTWDEDDSLSSGSRNSCGSALHVHKSGGQAYDLAALVQPLGHLTVEQPAPPRHVRSASQVHLMLKPDPADAVHISVLATPFRTSLSSKVNSSYAALPAAHSHQRFGMMAAGMARRGPAGSFQLTASPQRLRRLVRTGALLPTGAAALVQQDTLNIGLWGRDSRQSASQLVNPGQSQRSACL
ncbi:hypothetical protein V8C86DRAFT_2851794 [Haematococcus lacustris]